MNFALGAPIVDGPWGGGNNFVIAFSSYLRNLGHNVRFDLEGPVDIIMMVDPRPWSSSCAIQLSEITAYKKKNPQTIVVHRINECDERKGTHFVNTALKFGNNFADHTVYIASWLIELLKIHNSSDTSNKYSVVLNGASANDFVYRNRQIQSNEKIKIVTHHWGANRFKGWDIYEKLGELLSKPEYADKFEFHYIGNIPSDADITNIKIHPPASGKALGDQLAACDIYLTGSINEPAGMHHVEGALCGLPLLYRNSGALPEYCGGFGEMFNGVDDFELALNSIVENYEKYNLALELYNNDTNKMCDGYYQVCRELYEKRHEIMKNSNRSFIKILCSRLGMNLLKVLHRFGVS